MRRLRSFFVRLKNLFQPERSEKELAQELKATLQMQIDENLRSGMNPEEARRAALQRFGGFEQAKEQCRDARGIPLLESLWQDIRYGIRLLRKTPGFTTVAVLSLALGIGATTGIFSVVNAVLLRPLPFKDAERLVLISHEAPRVSRGNISAPTFTLYQDETRSFEELAVLENWSANFTGRGEPERISGYKVSAEFFPVLGIAPALGRAFSVEEDRPGANHVIVLSDGFWKRRFASDPSVINQTMLLDGIAYQVIGVMPPRFAFPRTVEFWTPSAFTPEELSDEQAGHGRLTAIARLHAGISLQEAQAEMDAFVPRVEERFPEGFSANLNWGIRISSLQDVLVGGFRSGLLIVFGLVGLVLLIACANVANLLLARSTARQKEIAIRMSVGSGRGRIIRQLLTESVVLGFFGGCSGVLVADLMMRLFVNAAPENATRFLPNWDEVRVDATVLIFTIVLCLCAVVIFGLAPALHTARSDVNEALKEEGRGSTSTAGRNRLRRLLVTSEVALAVVLLVASGLLIRSFQHVTSVDPGFRPENVLTMSLTLPTAKYAAPQEMASFWDRLVRHIDSVPGVESAGTVSRLPLRFGDSTGSFFIEGLVEPGTFNNLPRAAYRNVSPDYFRAMGIRLLEGRFFTHTDTADSTPVAIIDGMIARRYWPEGGAIGKRLATPPGMEGSYGDAHWREIVGIVAHVKHSGLDVDSEEGQLYIPNLQFLNPHFPQRSETVVVHTSSDPTSMFASIVKAIHAIDENLPVRRPMTMEQVVIDSLAQRRLSMILVGLFAGIALLLTVIGIYGVISYTVSQRMHEVGIRSALGASPGSILRLVVGEGLKLAIWGVAIGSIASLALSRLITSLLYGISTTDVVTYVSVTLFLTAIAILASYVPARRATRVDPVQALRVE